MRTITLELLRHGPAHNQLLSPLTEYLGLCGNHPAVSIRVPFEHSQFLAHLRSLEYRDSEKTGEMQMRNIAATLAAMLSGAPGLIAELSTCAGTKDDEPTHLRLVLSATELALLPFELTDAPNGFPGAGQSLLLQSQVPLCMTREVRRVSSELVDWPRKPRILFAAAAPGEAGPIPVAAHLLALRKVVEPWVYHYDEEKDSDREQKVGKHLTFLPRACLEDISRYCRTGDFTHIHILAHGVAFEQGEGHRYGLALHGRHSTDSMDLVDGLRLAKALRTHTATGDQRLTRPAVVTIASCRGGNVGSVVGTGASIAHALHEEGIPLVIASQFPLSFTGSVIMTDVLYQGLLRGFDPRSLLNDLRRRLRSEVPATNDWASIVAYAAFPANFDRQLERIRVRQAHRSIDAALNHADYAIQAMSIHSPGPPKDAEQQPAPGSTRHQPKQQYSEDALKEPLSRLSAAERKLSQLLSDSNDASAWMHGLLASTEKRLAETKWRATNYFAGMDKLASIYQEESRKALERSRDSYRNAFEADGSQSWALVQELGLCAVLRGGERVSEDAWSLARLLSQQDLARDDRQRKAWAHGNLIELLMLTRLIPNGETLAQTLNPCRRPHLTEQTMSVQDIQEIALEHARGLLSSSGPDAAEVHSTRRQMLRYIELFKDIYDTYVAAPQLPAADIDPAPRFDDLVEIAWTVVSELPESASFAGPADDG